MSSEQEIERLRRTYQGYRDSGQGEAKWYRPNRGNDLIEVERWSGIQRALDEGRRLPLTNVRVLDVGCGGGAVLKSLIQLGAEPANLFGVDLMPERIESARKTLPQSDFRVANAEQLPYEDGAFDLLISFTVFTSILDDTVARNVAGEMARCLRPGGAVLWYDYRYSNPSNPNVRAMPISRVQEFFPRFSLRLRRVTLLPPLARRLGPLTPALYPLLSMLPPLRTHYLGLLIKPA